MPDAQFGKGVFLNLFDCHTHLDEYPKEEIPSIMNRAAKVGVTGAIAAGTTLNSSFICVELSESDPRIFAGIGIHPMNIDESIDEDTYQTLRSLAENPRVVTISEVGLDGIAGAPEQRIQEDVFRSHIHIAREFKLSIIFHARDSYPNILTILEQEYAYEVGGAAHYFQGDIKTANRLIELGFFISLARPLLRFPELQEVVKSIPLEYIVLETDAYPQPFKRKRENWTEPRHLAEIANCLAVLKGIEVDTATKQVEENLFRMLGHRGNLIKETLT